MSMFRRLRRSSVAPGRYLTDGRGLFRVLSRFDDGRSLLVVIEHCVSLETSALAARELEAMGFRRVRNAARAAVTAPTRAGTLVPGAR